MEIDAKDAREALNVVDDARYSLAVLKGYRHSAPFLILWGVVWIAGFGLSDLLPSRTGLIWLVADAVGFAGSIWLGVKSPRRQGRFDWRPFAVAAVVAAFFFAATNLLHVDDMERFSGFTVLVFALIYTILGIYLGLRILIVGLVMGVVAVGGYYLVDRHYLMWLAAAGGGSLILGGLWLRRI
jgi:hypothetical protein